MSAQTTVVVQLKDKSVAEAQADAGRKPWDLDVALVSMAVASQMAKEGLLLRYVPQMKNAPHCS